MATFLDTINKSNTILPLTLVTAELHSPNIKLRLTGSRSSSTNMSSNKINMSAISVILLLIGGALSQTTSKLTNVLNSV